MSHAFLQDTIGDVIYNMASSDIDKFYDHLLVSYLRGKCSSGVIREVHVNHMYDLFKREKNALSFRRSLDAFQNDFHYAQMIAESSSST